MSINSVGIGSKTNSCDLRSIDPFALDPSHRHVVQEIFNISLEQIEPLKGGSGDFLYHIWSGSKEYVLRISSSDVEGFSILTEFASERGFGPQFVNKNIENRALLTEFVTGSPLSYKHLEDLEIIRQFADDLKTLHQSSQNLLPLSKVERKIAKLQSKGGFPRVTSLMDAIAKEIALCHFPLVPCHNDIHPGNLFFDPDQKIKFIDWGDAGMSDPFYDLARASIEFGFDAEQNSIFLDHYFGQPGPLEKARYYLMRQLIIAEMGINLLLSPYRQANENEKETTFHFVEKEVILPFEDIALLDTTRGAEAYFKTFLHHVQSREYDESIAILQNHQK